MKIKKKYIGWIGYIRFSKFELNWSVLSWSFPVSIDLSSEYYVFTQVLCVTIIFSRKFTSDELQEEKSLQ